MFLLTLSASFIFIFHKSGSLLSVKGLLGKKEMRRRDRGDAHKAQMSLLNVGEVTNIEERPVLQIEARNRTKVEQNMSKIQLSK